MSALFRHNSWLSLSLMCAWLMSVATAQAQVDQQSKKAGGGDSKSAAKDDESKGMGGGMSGGMT